MRSWELKGQKEVYFCQSEKCLSTKIFLLGIIVINFKTLKAQFAGMLFTHA